MKRSAAADRKVEVTRKTSVSGMGTLPRAISHDVERLRRRVYCSKLQKRELQYWQLSKESNFTRLYRNMSRIIS